MKFSTGSVVITAPIGVPLAGNGRADAASRGIHDDLRANILYMESQGQRLVFISLDLLGLLQKHCDAIKDRICEKSGIAREGINIFATHTHSGPNTLRIFDYFLTQEQLDECDKYLEWLVPTVAEAALDVIAKAQPGKMAYGHDVVEGFSFCRRIVLKDGSFRMVFEDYDPAQIDHLAGPNGNPIMSVFAFADPDDTVRAVMVHFTSHPAVVCGEDWLYTRDYIDALNVELQKRFGRDTVVLYANGAQGNQVAADPYRPFITGWEESERVGKALAEGAKRIVSRLLMEKKFKGDVPIRALSRTVTLPVRSVAQSDLDHAHELMENIPDKVVLHGLDPRVEASSILKMAEYPLKEEQVVIQGVRLGDQVIVTFPGEVFLEYGLQVMRASRRDVIVFGLANAYVGYIPIPAAFGQGGYEVKTSVGSSRFAPEAGELLAEGCIALVRELD